MIRRLSGLWLAAVLPFTFGAGTGCTDSCANVNCGSGLAVHWSKGTLPRAARYRLCVNDRCDLVRARRLPADADVGANDFYVGPPAAPDVDVAVRLELVDRSGRSIAVIRGRGRRTGGCCKYVSFHATPERTLFVDEL